MITIYHNPSCGTSRKTLKLIQDSGAEPVVIEHLRSPPTRTQIVKMVQDAGLNLVDAMRRKETIFNELGLADADDDTRLDAIETHPVLLNRPFVVTPLGTRLCRPSELVLEIL